MSLSGIHDVPNAESDVSPTTLVFCVPPKIPGAGHRGDIAKWTDIIRECRKLAIAMTSRRLVKNPMRERNVPSITKMENLRNLNPGHDVINYREEGG